MVLVMLPGIANQRSQVGMPPQGAVKYDFRLPGVDMLKEGGGGHLKEGGGHLRRGRGPKVGRGRDTETTLTCSYCSICLYFLILLMIEHI